MTLKKSLIKLINEKAKYENPAKSLHYTQIMIFELKSYLSGKYLDDHIIANHLAELFSYSTITLSIPFPNLKMLRAREMEQRPNFVHEVSYIKEPSQGIPKIGRLNKDGESLFYASMVNLKKDYETALAITFIEINPKKDSKIYVLESSVRQNKTLFINCIGIWYYVEINKKPSYLNNEIFQYYCKALKYIKSKFHSELFEAYRMTDKFFAEILRFPKSDKLYNLTSKLASLFLKEENVDGIIYESFYVDDVPLLALKPLAVDNKCDYCNITEYKQASDISGAPIKITEANIVNEPLIWEK